jgi:hypothetical protein
MLALAACTQGGGAGGVPPTFTSNTPPSLTGTWKLTSGNGTVVSCTSTLADYCSTTAPEVVAAMNFTGLVTIQQNGTQLVVHLVTCSEQPLIGTIIGDAVTFAVSCKDSFPTVPNAGTEVSTESYAYTGTVLSPNRMRGSWTTSSSITWTSSSPAGPHDSAEDEYLADWTATKT